MSAEIISFPTPPRVSGAREMVKAVLIDPRLTGTHYDLSQEDRFLGLLWQCGFKVVPIEAVEPACELSISDMNVVLDPSVPAGMILVKDEQAKKIVAAMIFGTGEGPPQ